MNFAKITLFTFLLGLFPNLAFAEHVTYFAKRVETRQVFEQNAFGFSRTVDNRVPVIGQPVVIQREVSGNGSGATIGKLKDGRDLILTVAHNLRPSKTEPYFTYFYIVWYNSQMIPCEVIAYDEKLDIAILACRLPTRPQQSFKIIPKFSGPVLAEAKTFPAKNAPENVNKIGSRQMKILVEEGQEVANIGTYAIRGESGSVFSDEHDNAIAMLIGNYGTDNKQIIFVKCEDIYNFVVKSIGYEPIMDEQVRTNASYNQFPDQSYKQNYQNYYNSQADCSKPKVEPNTVQPPIEEQVPFADSRNNSKFDELLVKLNEVHSRLGVLESREITECQCKGVKGCECKGEAGCKCPDQSPLFEKIVGNLQTQSSAMKKLQDELNELKSKPINNQSVDYDKLASEVEKRLPPIPAFFSIEPLEESE